MQKHTQTSGKQISLFGAGESTSLPEDSHASPIARQESEKGRRTNATYGRKCLGLFERSARAGSWAKTFAALLVGQEGWYSKRCRLAWKLRGTKYNRLYFLLQASAHPISGKEFGLLPTPQVFNGVPQGRKASNVQGGGRHSVTLVEMMAKGLLPTPTTQEVVHPEMELTPTGRRKARNGSESHSVGLADLAANGLLPTPLASGYSSELKQETVERPALHPRGKNLKETLQQEIGKSFQLNHRYCLEMMGFPPRWLDIPFQHGEKSSSQGQETP